MKKHITPAQYLVLNEENRWNYYPEYVKYKTIKYRDYQTCDLGHEHYVGWATKSMPVGEPIGYTYADRRLSYGPMRYYDDRMLESTLASTPKPLEDEDGKTITIYRNEAQHLDG